MKFLNFKKKELKEEEIEEVSAIKKFRDPEPTLIIFDELSKIPVNVTVQMVKERPGAIESTRITSNNENLMFTISMKKGEQWEQHRHDCEELIVLYRGGLIDEFSNQELKVGQIMIIKPYQSHYITALKDSIFYVEFKKPK